jgi:hypothetical protein
VVARVCDAATVGGFLADASATRGVGAVEDGQVRAGREREREGGGVAKAQMFD